MIQYFLWLSSLASLQPWAWFQVRGLIRIVTSTHNVTNTGVQKRCTPTQNFSPWCRSWCSCIHLEWGWEWSLSVSRRYNSFWEIREAGTASKPTNKDSLSHCDYTRLKRGNLLQFQIMSPTREESTSVQIT
jgi:hypothetical protein